VRRQLGWYIAVISMVALLAMLVVRVLTPGAEVGGVALQVEVPDGTPVTLQLQDGPVLFVAHWCPHCEHFLASTPPSANPPRVVSIWPLKGETFQDMVRNTRAKLERTGWGSVPFYVLMDADRVPAYVRGTPTLAWWDGRSVRAANPLEMTPDELDAVLGRGS